jgi:hypothetical protein
MAWPGSRCYGCLGPQSGVGAAALSSSLSTPPSPPTTVRGSVRLFARSAPTSASTAASPSGRPDSSSSSSSVSLPSNNISHHRSQLAGRSDGSPVSHGGRRRCIVSAVPRKGWTPPSPESEGLELRRSEAGALRGISQHVENGCDFLQPLLPPILPSVQSRAFSSRATVFFTIYKI